MLSTVNKFQGKKGRGKYAITDEVPLLDGECKIVRTAQSGGYWQFSMWVTSNKNYYRKSLKTRNKQNAKTLGIEEYFKIRHKLEAGETLSKITARRAADEYLSHQQDRVRSTGQHQGGITRGRYETIRAIINVHLIPFVGAKTRVDEIKGSAFATYYADRWKLTPAVRKSTLSNERSVISNYFGWMANKGYVSDRVKLEFGRLPQNTQKYLGSDERRDAFNAEEWRKIYTHLRYWSKRSEDDRDLYYRQLIRDFILIAANSGLRVGELRKLKWRMIDLKKNGGESKTARIEVPPDTKTGARVAIAEASSFFTRIKTYSPHTKANDYVFAEPDTGEPLKKKPLYRYWAILKKETGFDKVEKKLTYYSLRHTYCTFRLINGVDVFLLARNMGTSVKHIEEHYGHVKLDLMSDELTKRSRST